MRGKTAAARTTTSHSPPKSRRAIPVVQTPRRPHQLMTQLQKTVGNRAVRGLLQRSDPEDVPPLSGLLPPPLFTLNLPDGSWTFGPADKADATDPKVVALAEKFKALSSDNPDAYIEMQGYTDNKLRYDTEKETAQKTLIRDRLSSIRRALIGLGVPRTRVETRGGIHSRSAEGGSIHVSLYKKHATLSPGALAYISALPKKSAPAPAAPTKEEESSLPDIGLSKLTDHEIDIYIGTFKIKIPKSLELKFKHIPISKGMRLQFSVKGEISDLAGLLSAEEPKPEEPVKLGPPITVGFEVVLNGIPHFTIKGTVKANFQNQTLSFGIPITLVGGECIMTVPHGAISKIKEVEKEAKKYNAESTEKPPEDDIGRAVHVIELVDKLYQAIKEIEDAKGKCQKGPTLEIGPTVTVPFGEYPEGAPPDPTRRPVWGIGVTGRF